MSSTSSNRTTTTAGLPSARIVCPDSAVTTLRVPVLARATPRASDSSGSSKRSASVPVAPPTGKASIMGANRPESSAAAVSSRRPRTSALTRSSMVIPEASTMRRPSALEASSSGSVSSTASRAACWAPSMLPS